MKSNYSLLFFFVALLTLIPLSQLSSMKQISYISLVAVVSIFMALVYIIYDDIIYIRYESMGNQHLKWFDVRGIPYFFGTAMFMLEGNAVVLEIYS